MFPHQPVENYQPPQNPPTNPADRIEQTPKTEDSQFYSTPNITFPKANGTLFDIKITTDRLTITPFKIDNFDDSGRNVDLEDFQKLRKDPENMGKFNDGKIIGEDASKKRFEALSNRLKNFNPLGGFTVRTLAGGKYLGYFNLGYDGRFAVNGDKGPHLTMAGVGDHKFWRQGAGQEVVVAIAHYVRQLFDDQTVDKTIAEKMALHIKGLKYLVAPVGLNKEAVGQMLKNIKMDYIGNQKLSGEGDSDLYAIKIEDLLTKDLKVKKTSGYTDTIVEKPTPEQSTRLV